MGLTCGNQKRMDRSQDVDIIPQVCCIGVFQVWGTKNQYCVSKGYEREIVKNESNKMKVIYSRLSSLSE